MDQALKAVFNLEGYNCRVARREVVLIEDPPRLDVGLFAVGGRLG